MIIQKGSNRHMRILVSFYLVFTGLCFAQAQNEINFDKLGESNPTATFDHGYVAGWDLSRQQVHSATLYRPDGQKMFDVSSFSLPEGTKTAAPISVAIDTEGVSALVFWVQGDQRSGIAILDASGKQLQIIETLSCPHRSALHRIIPSGLLAISGMKVAFQSQTS